MPQTLYITDAISPLGRACAVRLGRAGWNLVLGGSSLSGLSAVCAELPHGSTLAARCDVADPLNVSPLLQRAQRRFGRLDAVLFNTHAREACWQQMLGGCVAALANTADLVAPLLQRSGGRLVVAGQQPGATEAGSVMHTVTRDAVRTLAGALDNDWQGHAHGVAVVEPRGQETDHDLARRIARVLNGAPELGEPALMPAAAASL